MDCETDLYRLTGCVQKRRGGVMNLNQYGLKATAMTLTPNPAIPVQQTRG